MASFFSDFQSYLQTTSYNRFALALFVFLLAMGYAVGFSIASQDAKNKKTEAFNTNLAVFTDWQMRISSTITRAATAAVSLASFAQGQISTPMNYSAPASSRLQILNPTAFELIATDLYNANPGIFSVELHSGGVISQMSPPDNSSLLLDLYAYANTRQQYATMWNGGNTLIAGPSNLLKISGYGLYVRQPIFISANKSKDTFWGTGNVVFKVSGPQGFLRLMNISELRNRHRMEHALWTYTTSGKLLTLDHSAEANMDLLLNSAMRMTLPVGEPGKACFFALFPTDGEVTDDISSDTIALVALVVLAGALVVIAAYYGGLLFLFCRRHRLAPTPVNGAPTFMALLTLRGAQAVVEHSPEEAQRVFASFIETVREASARYGCYAVMPIGDRCLYVVGSDLKATLSMASECVSGINIVALANADEAKEEAQRAVADLGSRHTSTANNMTSKKPKPTVALKAAAESGTPRESNYAHDRSDANSTCATQVVVGGESHITCHCSAVVRAAATTTRHYDSKSDVYFYGTSRDLGRAGSLLDQLKPRELGFTDGVDALCTDNGLEPFLAELSSSHESSSRRVLDKGRLSMVCVQWGSNGDSEDDEEDASYNINKGGARGKKHNDSSDDASTAMVIMSDILLKKLTSQNDREATLITAKSKAKNGTKNMKNSFLPSDQKRADGELPKDGNSTVSTILNDKTSNTTAKKGQGPQDSCSSDDEARNEAALLSRSCTVLAIRINGDPRAAFDTVKRVVEENRGRLVCCYENIMIAAYNLLSAGGHHQLRAADTVVRLRARLDGVVPFVAAIHHGKLSALVSASDGLVMPTGEVIQTCRVLLARANEMSCQLALALFERENTAGGAEIHHAVSGPSHGLCLLYCLAEMSSAYDCEAVDIEVRVVGAERKVNSSIVEMATFTSMSTVITGGGDVNDDLTHKAHLAAPNSTSATVKTSSRVVYRLGLSKLMMSSGNNNGKGCGTGQGATNASNSNIAQDLPNDVLAVLMRTNTTNYRTYGAAPASGGDDEWMYQLKDDQSAHSAVNLIFTRLQAGGVEEAELLYRRLCEDERLMAGLSVVAKKNLARLLKGS